MIKQSWDHSALYFLVVFFFLRFIGKASIVIAIIFKESFFIEKKLVSRQLERVCSIKVKSCLQKILREKFVKFPIEDKQMVLPRLTGWVLTKVTWHRVNTLVVLRSNHRSSISSNFSRVWGGGGAKRRQMRTVSYQGAWKTIFYIEKLIT